MLEVRTLKTGTKEKIQKVFKNFTGGDVYLSGFSIEENMPIYIVGTECQSKKEVSNHLIRCTLPSKPNKSRQKITGSPWDGQVVDYDNEFPDINVLWNFPKTMQAFETKDCKRMQRGQVVVLEDTRDNKKYRVKKMPDDKCWMIDNLRYAHSSWQQPGNGQWMTNNGQFSPQNDSNWSAWRYKNPGNSTNGCSAGSSAGCYGYLYNWYTATGGTGKYSTTSGNVAGNICPNSSSSHTTNAPSNKWQLPSGGGLTSANQTHNSDFAILNSSMKEDIGTNIPPTIGSSSNTDDLGAEESKYLSNWYRMGSFQGTFSGNYNASLSNQGSDGYYWSSTAFPSSNGAYYLYLSSSNVVPGSSSYIKNRGYAVRCVVR